MKGSGCIILLSPLISVISRLFFIWKGETSGVNFFLSRSTWSVLWPIAKQGTTCWEPCQPAMGSPCPCWWPLFSFRLVQNLRTCTCLLYLNLTFTGSTIVVICPLTTIAQQLMSDCNKYGINALAGHLVCGSHPSNWKYSDIPHSLGQAWGNWDCFESQSTPNDHCQCGVHSLARGKTCSQTPIMAVCFRWEMFFWPLNSHRLEGCQSWWLMKLRWWWH